MSYSSSVVSSNFDLTVESLELLCAPGLMIIVCYEGYEGINREKDCILDVEV
jgi:hypothetical protein